MIQPLHSFQIGQKCPCRKTIVAVKDPKKVGSKTIDLTPITGSEECIACRFHKGMTQTHVSCNY